MKTRYLEVLFVLVVVAVTSGMCKNVRAQQDKPSLVVEAVGGETFEGKGTDARFPKKINVRLGDHTSTMVALGSGVRKKAIFKVYEAVSYADESAGLNADPYQALLGGGVATRVVMYFVRDVGAEKIQNAWQDGFDKYLGEEIDTDLEKDTSAFLAFFAGADIEKGETIELTWLPDHGFFTSIAGQPVRPLQNPKLAAAVFSNWFSDNPISKDLKRDLTRFMSD